MEDQVSPLTYTAFQADRCIATGTAEQVAVAARQALLADGHIALLIFDDQTGRQVDMDLRGSEDELRQRLRPAPIEPARLVRGPGRPRLGVVAREVTLLPRHWEWLAAQPGGASVTLRKLVDLARRENAWQDEVRQAQAACDRFMMAMAGDRPGYEAASRALYAGDAAAFREHIAQWPVDIRAHAARLALAAFEVEVPANA